MVLPATSNLLRMTMVVVPVFHLISRYFRFCFLLHSAEKSCEWLTGTISQLFHHTLIFYQSLTFTYLEISVSKIVKFATLLKLNFIQEPLWWKF